MLLPYLISILKIFCVAKKSFHGDARSLLIKSSNGSHMGYYVLCRVCAFLHQINLKGKKDKNDWNK